MTRKDDAQPGGFGPPNMISSQLGTEARFRFGLGSGGGSLSSWNSSASSARSASLVRA